MQAFVLHVEGNECTLKQIWMVVVGDWHQSTQSCQKPWCCQLVEGMVGSSGRAMLKNIVQSLSVGEKETS